MYDIMLCRTNFLTTLNWAERRAIGLCEIGPVGSSFWDSEDLFLASFQLFGILVFMSEKFKISVRPMMVSGVCFKCY